MAKCGGSSAQSTTPAADRDNDEFAILSVSNQSSRLVFKFVPKQHKTSPMSVPSSSSSPSSVSPHVLDFENAARETELRKRRLHSCVSDPDDEEEDRYYNQSSLGCAKS